MSEKNPGMLSSLQGVIAATAALVTAVTGLYLAVNNSALFTGDGTAETGGDAVVVVTPAVTAPKKILKRFPSRGELVDCSQFPSVNSTETLMSWSHHYQDKIIEARGQLQAATRPCNKTIDYRGQAYCQQPGDAVMRSAFLETLKLCRAAGIEWTEIEHTEIYRD